MNGPESKPWVWPMRSPSLRSDPALELAASAAKRHERGELRGSSRVSAAKSAVASADACIARGLHELPPAVELVGLVREGAAALADHRAQRGPRPVDVGADGRDRVAVAVVLARGPGVHGQQLGEVVERAEREARDVLEAREL